jgi:hypothetical protein
MYYQSNSVVRPIGPPAATPTTIAARVTDEKDLCTAALAGDYARVQGLLAKGVKVGASHFHRH